MLHTAITAPDWTASVPAQRLLATFAKHPPRYAPIASHARWTRETEAYVGYRYEALTALWRDAADPLLAECDKTGDYTAINDFLAQPSVDMAIKAACAQVTA